MPRPPRAPADQRRRELERVAGVPVVARGRDRQHVVEERQLERARLRLGEARAGEAHVDDARLAPDRDVDPGQHVGQEEAALGVPRRPHGEDLGAAGHAPAAQAVVVPARRSGRSRTCRGPRSRSRRSARTRCRTVRLIWPANSGWFTSRPVSTTATRRLEPPPTAAIASPARTVVVGPRELDAGVGVEPVELVDRDGDGRVALHVGHARVVPQSAATAAAPEGTVAAITPVRSSRSGVAPSAGARRPPRPCPRACARPRADAPGRPSGRSGRAPPPDAADAEAVRMRSGRGSGTTPALAACGCEPERRAQLLALDDSRRRLRGRS